MGVFGDWFKLQPQTDEQQRNSAAMMKRLKSFHGEDTGKYLSLMQDPWRIPTLGPAPTIEDVDKLEVDAFGEGTYTAPVESLSTAEPDRLPTTTAAPVNGEMLKWVNGLFTELAVRASFFNSSAEGTHQVITVHAPDFAWETKTNNESISEEKIVGFKAHLATRQWAMLISGSAKKVEIYVVPSAEILDFSLHGNCDSRYRTFMTIDTSDVELSKLWRISGAAMTFESIPLLAKQLISDLVRISTGKISVSELFEANDSQPGLAEKIARGNLTQPPRAELETGSSPPTPSRASSALNPSIVRMHTWTASSELLQAIDEDLPWLTELKSQIDFERDRANSVRLEDLITRLRQSVAKLAH